MIIRNFINIYYQLENALLIIYSNDYFQSNKIFIYFNILVYTLCIFKDFNVY